MTLASAFSNLDIELQNKIVGCYLSNELFGAIADENQEGHLIINKISNSPLLKFLSNEKKKSMQSLIDDALVLILDMREDDNEE